MVKYFQQQFQKSETSPESTKRRLRREAVKSSMNDNEKQLIVSALNEAYQNS